MVDVLMIQERLKRLAQYVEFLEKRKTVSYEEFDEDKTIEWSVERALQVAIQIVVDISTHILNTTSNLTPQDYADAIIKLGKIGVIPADFAKKIERMPGFRNILVHQYAEIDTRRVYQNMQEELEDFILFARYITDWLDRNGLSSPPDSKT